MRIARIAPTAHIVPACFVRYVLLLRLLNNYACLKTCIPHVLRWCHCRGMGEPKAGLNNAIVVGAVNLVLDPVLMFACGLGVTGAAMATAAAQWVSHTTGLA